MTSEAFDATVAMLAATNLAGEAPLAERRSAIDGLAALLGTAVGTSTEDVDADGVPARWVHPERSNGDGRAVLWLHGGGYNIGSRDSHTPAASHLAAALGAPVLVADYRLAPEHPHPAALEDATTVWRWLTGSGWAADALGVAGDSAGGGLALALAVTLRDAGDAAPGALALLCPWVDLTGASTIDPDRAAADIVLSADLLEAWAATYADATPLTDPAISPIGADLHGLPPMLIHAGGRDILCDQAMALATAAERAGGTVDLVVDDDMIHAWHIFAGAFPEAGDSLGDVAAWLGQRLGAR